MQKHYWQVTDADYDRARGAARIDAPTQSVDPRTSGRAARNAAQSAAEKVRPDMSTLRVPFKNVGENKGSHSWSSTDQTKDGRGGSRTRTRVTPQRILSRNSVFRKRSVIILDSRGSPNFSNS